VRNVPRAHSARRASCASRVVRGRGAVEEARHRRQGSPHVSRRAAYGWRPFLVSRPACNQNCLATRAPRSPIIAGTRGGKCPLRRCASPLPLRLSQGRRPAATDDRPTQRRRRYHSSPALVGATPTVAGAFRRAREPPRDPGVVDTHQTGWEPPLSSPRAHPAAACNSALARHDAGALSFLTAARANSALAPPAGVWNPGARTIKKSRTCPRPDLIRRYGS
jgi:hypothetical protein